MRIYYIPTTTLNFNNILSSESISPKAFYALRGFGYPSWEAIPENNVDNAIILYEKPFGFVRPASDLEDHPMLIEILSEENFPSAGKGVYYCDHTIYLSPVGTRFIFFSEQSKHITLSRSMHSIETKIYDWNKKNMVVDHFPCVRKRKISLEIKLNKEAIEKDYRIDKMKGLLYGYYIGGVFSLEDTRKYNILQELRDIALVVMSLDKHDLINSYQIKVESLLKEFQQHTDCGRLLNQLNTDWNKVCVIIDSLISRGAKIPDLSDIHDFKSYLFIDSKRHLFSQWLETEFSKFDQHAFDGRFLDGAFSLIEPENKEIIIKDLHLSEIKISDKQNFYGLDIGLHIDEDALNGLHTLDIELLKTWVNDVLSQKKYNENPSSRRAELSDEITLKAKEIYGDLWNTSRIRISLNELRKYVRLQDNNFNWFHFLTSTIAAVITKGDDWKKLLTFMWSKEMLDYRWAFALYGELKGFASLDKDFIEYFYGLYGNDAYEEISEQLFGIYPIIWEKESDVAEGVKQEIPLPIPWQSWQDNMREIITEENIVKRNKKETMEDFERAIKQNGSNEDIPKFMELLLTFENWHTKKRKPTKAWLDLKEAIDLYFNA